MQHKNLTIENSRLAAEWDYVKNGDLRPENFKSNSRKFIWWKCAWGHRWQERINNRVKGKGCPYDAGIRTADKFKPLAVERPDIAAEWDYVKNDFLSPEDADINANINAWWHCNNGHSWKAKLADRLKGSDCPVCGSNVENIKTK